MYCGCDLNNKKQNQDEITEKFFIPLENTIDNSGADEKRNKNFIAYIVIGILFSVALLYVFVSKDKGEELVNNQSDNTEIYTSSGNDLEYSTGAYRLLYDVKVRKGPSTSYERLGKSQLPESLKVSSNDNGGLLEGTDVYVIEIVKNDNQIWGKIDIGYICLYNDEKYAEFLYQ